MVDKCSENFSQSVALEDRRINFSVFSGAFGTLTRMLDGECTLRTNIQKCDFLNRPPLGFQRGMHIQL